MDGLAVCHEAGGIVKLALYATQPVVRPGAEPTDPCEQVRVVTVKLIFTSEARAVMRRQVQHLSEPPPAHSPHIVHQH